MIKKKKENPAQLANRIMQEGGKKSSTYKKLDAQTKKKKPLLPKQAPQRVLKKAYPSRSSVVKNSTLRSDPTAGTPLQPDGQTKKTFGDRLKNVGAVVKSAFDFNKETKVKAGFDVPVLSKVTEAAANHPFATASIGHGAFTFAKGVGTALSATTGRTAVQKAAEVGTKDILGNAFTKGTTAANIPVNSATAAKTSSWLGKLAATAKNPQAVIGGLMGALGSYPFAGFIKEEALQTIGFATKVAMDNDDLAGAEEAIALNKEILNPGMWDKIKAGIPFVNVLDSLDNFYEASQVKLSVDEKLFDDKRKALEEGETPEQKEKRLAEEEKQDYQANIDYYNSERKKLLQWELQAKAEAREADARFWAKEKEKQRQKEKEDREAIAKFWEAYKKESQKANEAFRPSKLNFGLI